MDNDAEAARRAFFAQSTSITDLNGRIVFAELLCVPDVRDVQEYCQQDTLRRWVSVGNQYFRLMAGGQRGVIPYTLDEVLQDYLTNIHAVTSRIKDFVEDGAVHLREIARSSISNEMKLERMLLWRAALGVPTKEPIECRHDAVIVCKYLPGLREDVEEALRAAMRGMHDDEDKE